MDFFKYLLRKKQYRWELFPKINKRVGPNKAMSVRSLLSVLIWNFFSKVSMKGPVPSQKNSIVLFYRVSHRKVNKVILPWWGYRFLFLLIFWILHFHEIGPFIFQSSVFIELMIWAIYGLKCKHANKFFWKKSLNVPFVKLFFSTFFGFIHAFLFWAIN